MITPLATKILAYAIDKHGDDFRESPAALKAIHDKYWWMGARWLSDNLAVGYNKMHSAIYVTQNKGKQLWET